jgi:hypothetical protein
MLEHWNAGRRKLIVRYRQNSYEKNTPRKKERQAKPSPLRGEGKGGGARTERHSKDI